ncbi:TPA: FMN-binding negative transcriptional regulator [Serratia odorifera]|nr:FMN-binding negative transcriptional regulator [Serratia odorifera]
MYLPEHFAETRVALLHQLIEQNPLGILITNSDNSLDANHIPFELNAADGEFGVLHCHIARKNPLWQALSNGQEVLVVFRADDAYISPQWLPSKHETHKQVPSWNYRVVHAVGRVTLHDDLRYVRGLVARLTRKHEAFQAAPWKMADGPKDYIDAMLTAIVGIEIEITQLVGKFKLSQNKESRDIDGVGSALKARGEHPIGDAMLAVAADKKKSA